MWRWFSKQLLTTLFSFTYNFIFYFKENVLISFLCCILKNIFYFNCQIETLGVFEEQKFELKWLEFNFCLYYWTGSFASNLKICYNIERYC